MTAFRHILVPTDFEPPADRALEVALDLAARFECKLTILHSTWMPPYYYSSYAEGLAWPLDEIDTAARKALDERAAKARSRRLQVETVLAAGDAWKQVIEVVQERAIDLVVMGTHGRRGAARLFLGSVAEKVVRLSPVPVLTVPANVDPHAEHGVADR